MATNVLTFFYANSRGHELSTTLDWVYSVLLHEAYIDGTMYYYSPDAFLYFLSRLLPFVFERFASLFAKRCRERIGVDGDALALAMRVVAASAVGIEDRVDLDALLKMQEEDGAFPTGWVYKYGGSGILIGNRGLTTSMAVQAVESVELMDTMTGNHAYI